MGAIVSSSPEVRGDQERQGSAVTAAQAKIRHELLQEHFQRGMEQDPRAAHTSVGVANPEWYPAGVSPSYLPLEKKGGEPDGMSAAEEVHMGWMDSHTLSSRELHRAAADIKSSLLPQRKSADSNEFERRSSLSPSSLLRRDDYFSIQSSQQLSSSPQHIVTSLSLDNTSSPVTLPSLEMLPFPHITPSSPNRDPSPSLPQLSVSPTLRSGEVTPEESEIPEGSIIRAREVPVGTSGSDTLAGTEGDEGCGYEGVSQQGELSMQRVVQRLVVEPRLLGRPRRNESRRSRSPQDLTLKAHLTPHSPTSSTPHLSKPRSSPLHSPVRGLHHSLSVTAFPPRVLQNSTAPNYQEMTFAGPGAMKTAAMTQEGARPFPRKAARSPFLEEPQTLTSAAPKTPLPKAHLTRVPAIDEGSVPTGDTPHPSSSPQPPRAVLASQHLKQIANSPLQDQEGVARRTSTSQHLTHVANPSPQDQEVLGKIPASMAHLPPSPQTSGKKRSPSICMLLTNSQHSKGEMEAVRLTPPPPPSPQSLSPGVGSPHQRHIPGKQSFTSPSPNLEGGKTPRPPPSPQAVSPGAEHPRQRRIPGVQSFTSPSSHKQDMTSQPPPSPQAPSPGIERPRQRHISGQSHVRKVDGRTSLPPSSLRPSTVGHPQQTLRTHEFSIPLPPRSGRTEAAHHVPSTPPVSSAEYPHHAKRRGEQQERGLDSLLEVRGTSSKSRREAEGCQVWAPDSALVTENQKSCSQERLVNVESLAVEANFVSVVPREVSAASKVRKREGEIEGEIDGDEEEMRDEEEMGDDEEEGEEGEEDEDEGEKEGGADHDSLVKLLYSEVTEGLEQTEQGSKVKENKKLLQKIHTVMVLENMQGKAPPAEYGDQSILLAPPDREDLKRAGEFRGDVVNHLDNLTPSIKLDYYQFIEDFDQMFFYTAQQAEAGLKDYSPRTILDYHHETPQGLLDKIQALLDGYMLKAKAKYLGIVCKGGPGYFYLMKNMPVTPAKIRNNVELLEFWQKAGGHMSKLIPQQSFIHLMESNVTGNKQGEALLKDLEYSMFSHRVKIESPLEISAAGKKMLGLYFNTAQHKLWKASRYSKVKLFK